MKRQRSTSRGRMARDGERLVALARRLNDSGSRLEERYWERELETLLIRLLRGGSDNAVETALDHLFDSEGMAYEVLVTQCESTAECQVVTHAGEEFDTMLLAAPILAWTRFAIPSGPLKAADVAVLQMHLGAHVLATDARIVLAPYLFSLEQMPLSFAETFALTSRFTTAALTGNAPRLDLADGHETAPLLADSRFLLAGVAVPRGKPIFRWQEQGDTPAAHPGRVQCLADWETQARPNLAPLLPSCGFELLLPDAFYISVHESDRRIRPYTIKASAAYLEGALKVEATQLRATVAAVGETGVDEYRIGFAAKGSNAVVAGVIWPLYGREGTPGDEGAAHDQATVDEITTQLKAAGITNINVLPGRQFPEFCEDCGAPFYPDPKGEFVHDEPPDEGDGTHAHFH